MGRPEPCVLFVQNFVHPQLDEYVDEVLFAEPVVITACEFLEQNASSASPVITLLGATSPPSFALEVFVHCEGETRFRRLCQPFLYSHSSSNVLELEAVVTSHLVIRGSYRSLSLVIYGNTAEDLGQFNIEFDLDNSLANVVCSPEGKLEDLPPALQSNKLKFEESISALNSLSLPVAKLDLSVEIKQFVHLILKIIEVSDLGDAINKVVSTIVSAVSYFITNDLHVTTFPWDKCKQSGCVYGKGEFSDLLTDARDELLQIYRMLEDKSGNESDELVGGGVFLESEADLPTSQLLLDALSQFFNFKGESSSNDFPVVSQNKNLIGGLSLIILLCSAREGCFHFVNGGGMEHLARAFCHLMEGSTAITLLLLGVVEQATRHAVGCEGFLGWWPREEENVPAGSSEGYTLLLKLLLQKQRHDVASLATYILHRLRSYEVASRYESAVLSLLGDLSTGGKITGVSLNMLSNVKLELRKLLKLINSRGLIEDPSLVACVRRSVILCQTEGLLSYKATINLIASSSCCFHNWDIDPHLLSLLSERGFLPLSAALLSSRILRSEVGYTMDIFVDIASSIGAILLSLLFCRSGLIFLLLHPEVTSSVILALESAEDIDKEECVPLRYTFVLLSKGFFCRPQEVGIIMEMHLRVVNAIDRLLISTPHSEEFLWVLWEICSLSRSDCGRQALLALGQFPEAVSVLIEALRCGKDLESPFLTNGASPLNLAIFHSAAEIFEVLVTDSTSSSLGSWIEHAMELHKALHSSSPGSNRKDAPTRLLEWIDAGVVYHRNGAIGLLRYAAILTSGGDAHLTSTSILVSDSLDVENVVGDSSSGSDGQVIENLLGKLVFDKSFDGITLRDSSIAQLTTAFRILAFISENSAVAAALYDEGAITLIYIVLVNCKFMLERSSNIYDYLVDEGAECNSTSDLLLERSREQSLVDLLIPSLLLLIALLHKLQETKEQHRNKKLLNALLQLHREVSPKLAACAADLSSPYPGSALGLGSVCRLLVSALAFWPVYGWSPGLFHCLLNIVEDTSKKSSVEDISLLSLGPKEACSLLCLLSDLFPEEGIWLWENGMPSLSALRAVAVGSLLGPQKEGQVDWYLQRGHTEMLLTRLTPLLDKISQIILQFSFTALLVIQDMLRVLIIRISCQSTDNAIVLLRPMLSWAQDHISEPSLSDMDVFKVYRLLDFLASLLEHPHAKVLLFEVGAVSMLTKALERCVDTSHTDGKLSSGIHIPAKNGFCLLSWCLPVLKSFSLMCDSRASLYHYKVHNKYGSKSLSTEDCSLILIQLLKLFQVLPVGRELLACLATFKELGTLSEGKSAFASISAQIRSSGHEDLEYHKGYERDGSDNILDEYDWARCPPLLYCWKNILRSIDEKDGSLTHAIEALSALSIGALRFCVEGKSFNMDVVAVLRCLFGLPRDSEIAENFPEENIKDVQDMIASLDRMVHEDDYSSTSDMKNALHQAMDYAKSMVFLLQQPIDSIKVDDVILSKGFPLSSTKALVCSKMCPPHLLVPSLTKLSVTNDFVLSISHGRNIDTSVENPDNCISLGGLADKFLWECPEVLPDRLTMPVLPGKRKLTSIEGLNRRARGETPGPETMGSNTFSRGLGPLTAPSGPTRRDTFRQRKPNTSRPPSMHVDDYVARERNVDGINSNSNVNLVQRGGTSGGRPPSIHVDEFMARQRERQNPVAMAVGDVTRLTKNAPPEDGVDSENRSKKLKADLDDDLHELNIVFDGEESESDDRLPFPQADDILQPASVIIEEHSPHSIVGETDSEVNKSSQFSHLGARSASHVDENTQSELSSRMSMARPEITLTREASVSSDSKYFETNQEKASLQEHSDDTNNAVTASGGFESAAQANLSSFSIPFYYKDPASSIQVLGDSRVPPPFYQDSPQQATTVPLVNGSQGFHDQKFLSSQPPLPPLPPPMTVSSVVSQSVDPVQFYSTPYGQTIRDLQSAPPMGYQLQSFDASGPNMVTSFHVRDERPPHSSAAGALPSVSSSAFGESINQPFNSQLQTEYLAAFNGSPTPLTSSHPMRDTKYSWDSVSSAGRSQDEINSSGASARPLPPLPPMPPPFAAASFNQAPAKSSTSKSSVYNQSNVGTSQPLSDARLGTLPASGGSLTSYSPPSVVPPLLLTRPLSIPGTLISNTISQQQGQNPPSLLHTIPTQPAIQSLQPRAQLQALQPPQPPRPPPQHLRPPQVSQQSEQGASLLHSPIHVQVQPLQMQQQPHVSPIHVYYQSQQHEHHLSHLQQQQVEHSQPQNLPQQGDNAQQKQQDSGMSLQQYFSSPEAIQALLSDREKLCQLLEQHPKLMQMLQEKLGQL